MATLERQVHVHDMYILFCICILLGCMAIKGRYMTCTYCFVSCIWLCRCLDTAARHHHPHQFCSPPSRPIGGPGGLGGWVGSSFLVGFFITS